MPPPKVKLHKNTGKTRSGSPRLAQTADSIGSQTESQPGTSLPNVSDNPATGLTPEQEQQFQTELYWCIQQLQTALSSNKLTNKQIQENTKALNTLMSNAVPMVKKRQVMRLSFGDYRTKMLDDEKKTKKLSIKVTAGKPSDKSMFLRKAIITSPGNNFKFNFPTPEKINTENQLNTEEIMETELVSKVQFPLSNIIFTKSDNNFRFNFSTDNIDNANGN